MSFCTLFQEVFHAFDPFPAPAPEVRCRTDAIQDRLSGRSSLSDLIDPDFPVFILLSPSGRRFYIRTACASGGCFRRRDPGDSVRCSGNGARLLFHLAGDVFSNFSICITAGGFFRVCLFSHPIHHYRLPEPFHLRPDAFCLLQASGRKKQSGRDPLRADASALSSDGDQSGAGVLLVQRRFLLCGLLFVFASLFCRDRYPAAGRRQKSASGADWVLCIACGSDRRRKLQHRPDHQLHRLCSLRRMVIFQKARPVPPCCDSSDPAGFLCNQRSCARKRCPGCPRGIHFPPCWPFFFLCPTLLSG